MMYLADTNIFLEILLQQDKSNLCKEFIQQHLGVIALSDFSLHSLGVITFRQRKPDLFIAFAQEMLPHLRILTLPVLEYEKISSSASALKLDFDDTYQYHLAKAFDLKLVTLDRDFRFISDIQIQFL